MQKLARSNCLDHSLRLSTTLHCTPPRRRLNVQCQYASGNVEPKNQSLTTSCASMRISSGVAVASRHSYCTDVRVCLAIRNTFARNISLWLIVLRGSRALQRRGLGWTCPPRFCQRLFLGSKQISTIFYQ